MTNRLVNIWCVHEYCIIRKCHAFNEPQCDTYAFNRLNRPPPEEEVIEKGQHEKLIGQLK